MCNFRLDLELEFDTGFNVGSGAMSESWADKPFVRDWRGLPMIPASSLKGRLRHECERLARALYGEQRCQAPTPDTMCQVDPHSANVEQQLCPTCRLFGSPWYESPVAFSDLELKEPAFLLDPKYSPRTSLRYGVALSRHRRVAEERLLYTTEVFEPGGVLVFAGTIEGRAADGDLALLVGGLDSLFTLGGGKSRGLGWFKSGMRLYRAQDDGTDEERPLEEIRGRFGDEADQA